jgi:hypothetical protein
MKIRITEQQYKSLITELSPKSSGVKEFLKLVKDTPGLLRHLKFNTHKALEEYILDGYIKDFDELRDEADEFLNKKSKK